MEQLDLVDRGLLKLLQRDGKMKIKELAHQLNMSISPIFERIKKLENGGIIKRYKAVLDANKCGLGLTAFCNITLKDHHQEHIEGLVDVVRKMPEVTECYHIAGQFDYLLKIVVKDMEAYQHFITTKLASTPFIARVQSSFVMTAVKEEGYLEIEAG